jgi:hypothetical protein
MASVNKIKEAIAKNGGVAQGCHYIFTIVPPRVFGLGDVVGVVEKGITGTITLNDGLDLGKKLAQQYVLSQAEHISLLAESVSLPGRQMLTTEQRIFGTVRKMPYGVMYEDFTVTFICTNSMIERTFFDLWHQLIMSSGSQYMEFYDNYVGTLIIQKVSNSTAKKSLKDKIVQMASKYKLLEAYPISIQSQELNYADGEYLKLTVQFAYAKWKATFDDVLDYEPNLPWIGQSPLSTGEGDISGSLQPTPATGATPNTGGNKIAPNPGPIGQNQDGTYIYPPGYVPPNGGGSTTTPLVPPTANPPMTPAMPEGAIGQNPDGSFIFPPGFTPS